MFEHAIMLKGSDDDWGWYMNGYLVALRYSPEEVELFKNSITPVSDGKNDPGPLGTNVDRNQFTHPKWVEFTYWMQKKWARLMVSTALFNNSLTGY